MEKAEEMEIGFSFCDEIEEEILLRLPAKSVSRFNCVSKTWYTRITSSEFAHKHLKHKRQTQSNNFNLMLHSRRRGPLQSVICRNNDAKTIKHHDKLNFINRGHHNFIIVFGSCDGLLLVGVHTALGVDRVIYIWNPTTGQHKALPPLSANLRRRFVFGFGPDLTTTDNINHYKVLLLLETVPEETESEVKSKFKVNMYTTHTSSWKTLLPNAPFSYSYPRSKGMILAYDNLHYKAEIDTDESAIMSFDLKDDKFRVLPMVPGTMLINLCALNGDLCAFSYTDDYLNFYGLWKMENFGVMKEECWTEIYSIDRRLAMDKPITFISPLHVLKDGQILLYAELKSSRLDDKPFIVSYNTENKQASFLVQDNVALWSIPVVYEESFISPNAACTTEEELPRQLKCRRMKR